MTVDGEFLHYIFPLQFLDSPEWDSLRPTEEGIFQVKVEGLVGLFVLVVQKTIRVLTGLEISSFSCRFYL